MTAYLRRLAPLLAAAVLSSACTASATDDGKQAPSAAGGSGLAAAVKKLPVQQEHASGYDRDKFKLWVDEDGDGCDTRKEVLIEEATTKPKQGDNCRLSGGEWTSYYDGKTVTRDRQLDIDHVVPLAEAWASGGHTWDAEKRERYANDLGAEASLVAVSLGPNRSKGDRDPAEWMPPSKSAHCRYASEWTATKLRWKLTVDRAEKNKLKELAGNCPDAKVNYEPAK